MKVTRNTPDQLIVADNPWIIGALLIVFILVFVAIGVGLMLSGEWFGLLFTGIGIGGGLGFAAFAAFVRRVQVILDRPTNTILIRSRSLFGYKQVQHDLSNLSRAVLEATSSSNGGTLYRPALVLDKGMSKGTHPIVETYTNTGGPRHLVAAINSWLD